MIEKMLRSKVAMISLCGLLSDLVNDAERTYCASGKADDRQRWYDLLQSRASLFESMALFGKAGGAEIITYGQLKRNEALNANSEAL